MKLIAFITLILLTGCATSADHKPLQMSEQEKKDRSTCMDKAKEEMAANPTGYGMESSTANDANFSLREGDLINICMKAKGVY